LSGCLCTLKSKKPKKNLQKTLKNLKNLQTYKLFPKNLGFFPALVAFIALYFSTPNSLDHACTRSRTTNARIQFQQTAEVYVNLK